MKAFLFLYILAVCVLSFSCASTGKNQRVISKDTVSEEMKKAFRKNAEHIYNDIVNVIIGK